MMRLKIIAFFLSLVMAIQVIPVAQIGMALSSNQWTEEIPHTPIEKMGGDDGNIFTGNYLPTDVHRLHAHFEETTAELYIHTSEKIPSNHSTDVVSPPPDVLSV